MPSHEDTGQTGRPEDIEAVPVRHPGRWIAAVVILVLGASLVRSAATRPGFQWGVVGDYLFDTRDHAKGSWSRSS